MVQVTRSGGTGKAEHAKLPGAGIGPKQCPMERVGTEAMHRNGFQSRRQGPEPHDKSEINRADFLADDGENAK